MKPVEKKSLYLKISDSVYGYIQMNNLQAGDKLPSERDMAAMLQTSRNSVREGLRILEDRGMIEVRTGRGVFVKSLYGENSSIQIRLQNCSIQEIQELQSVLDHQAVINATNRAEESEKDEMLSIAEEMVKLADKNIYSHVLDHSFHSLLYKSGRNSAIEQIIVRIREERFVRQEDSESGNDLIWLNTIPQHLDLAKAIKRCSIGDGIKAIDEINEFGFRIVRREEDERDK